MMSCLSLFKEVSDRFNRDVIKEARILNDEVVELYQMRIGEIVLFARPKGTKFWYFISEGSLRARDFQIRHSQDTWKDIKQRYSIF